MSSTGMLASTLDNVVDHLFVGPMIPATIMAALCGVYLLISLLGVFDFGVDGGPELDVDTGVDLDAGADFEPGGEAMSSDIFGGLGAATLRAVNLDRVPLMLWMSAFSVLFWLFSFLLWFEFDVNRYAPIFTTSVWLVLRNVVLAVVATRFVTRPLHRLLQPSRQYHAKSLVGESAVVETDKVDGEFGRARYQSNAAPLLIRIRTAGETLQKGARVDLLDYDAATREYLVAATESTKSV